MTEVAGKAGQSSWRETVKIIAQALILAVIFRAFFFQPFSIPSGSMKDTLLVGDYLFVSKLSYGYSRYSFPWAIFPFDGRIFSSDPKRGDVVVFKLPRDNTTDYIKRVIGLPGDHIEVHNGIVSINGKMAPQNPAGEYAGPEGKSTQAPLPGDVAQWREALRAALGTPSRSRRRRAVRCAPGSIFHDGRQSRQFDRQSRSRLAAWGGLRAGAKSDRSR